MLQFGWLKLWPTSNYSFVVMAKGVDFLCLCFVIAPFGVCVFSFLVGAFFAIVEGWDVMSGFWYVSCNVAGVNPYVNNNPTTVVGDLLDVAVSFSAIAIGSTLISLTGMLSVVSTLPEIYKLSDTKRGLLALFLLIPCALAVLAAVIGSLFALLEGWEMWQGFKYVASVIGGLANPITQVTPQTPHGMLIAIIVGIATQGMEGVIVGIAGGVTLFAIGVQKLTDLLEGEAAKHPGQLLEDEMEEFGSDDEDA